MANRSTVLLKTPIERLLSLPEAPSVLSGIGTDGVSYRVGCLAIPKHDLRILNDAEMFDKLVRVHGPLRLRLVLGLSRREMAQALVPHLHHLVSKQALIGWERRESKGLIDKYMIGRVARIAYWDLIDTLQCSDGWRAVVDRRHTVYWHVTLKEPK